MLRKEERRQKRTPKKISEENILLLVSSLTSFSLSATSLLSFVISYFPLIFSQVNSLLAQLLPNLEASKRGFDAVFDSLGGDYFTVAWKLLRPAGKKNSGIFFLNSIRIRKNVI